MKDLSKIRHLQTEEQCQRLITQLQQLKTHGAWREMKMHMEVLRGGIEEEMFKTGQTDEAKYSATELLRRERALLTEFIEFPNDLLNHLQESMKADETPVSQDPYEHGAREDGIPEEDLS